MNIHLVGRRRQHPHQVGRCARRQGEPIILRLASLGDDPAAWQRQLDGWIEEFSFGKEAERLTWALAGVHPERCGRLREWIAARGDRVVMIDRYDRLPLAVDVDEPKRVGLDRLLNAVAAKTKLPPGRPAVLVDAGSAVTVDWLDEQHVFRGGAIFPGARLMAKALHDYTALLPQVEVGPPAPVLPGRSTVPAMQAGVFWAVIGGIDRIAPPHLGVAVPHIFLTGGDAEWIAPVLEMADFPRTLWPEQTLQGVLCSAGAPPS